MTPEQALDIIAQACAAVQGNLQTHQQIQQALKVLHDEVAAPVESNGKGKVSAGTKQDPGD